MYSSRVLGGELEDDFPEDDVQDDIMDPLPPSKQKEKKDMERGWYSKTSPWEKKGDLGDGPLSASTHRQSSSSSSLNSGASRSPFNRYGAYGESAFAGSMRNETTRETTGGERNDPYWRQNLVTGRSFEAALFRGGDAISQAARQLAENAGKGNKGSTGNKGSEGKSTGKSTAISREKPRQSESAESCFSQLDSEDSSSDSQFTSDSAVLTGSED